MPEYSCAFSGFVPTSRLLTSNGGAQELSAARTWTIDTLYTANCTLTCNRIVNPSASNYTLTLNPTLIQGATFRGYVSKTVVSGFGTTGTINNILASDVDATYTGNAFTELYNNYQASYITNSGSAGNSLVRGTGYYTDLSTRGQTTTSNIALV